MKTPIAWRYFQALCACGFHDIRHAARPMQYECARGCGYRTERVLAPTQLAAVMMAYLVIFALFGAASIILFRKADTQRRQLVAIAGSAIDSASSVTQRLVECEGRADAMGGMLKAMQQVGATPYVNPGNNCYDHSKALVKALADAGIASSIYVNANRTHAWVAVWIESTDGQFVTPARAASLPYGPPLEVRDHRLAVICAAPRK